MLCGCIAGIFEILRAEKGSGESSAALLYRAAALGISAHVTAGRLAAERFGQHGVLAGDTADMLGLALEAVNAPPR